MVAADGPLDIPCTAWHFQDCTRANTSRPALMRSAVTAGSGGIVMGVPGFSLVQRGEKCFTQATRSARSCLVKVLHCGMFERSRPRALVSNKSWSVCKVPVGVYRHLTIANWKSRCLGATH